MDFLEVHTLHNILESPWNTKHLDAEIIAATPRHSRRRQSTERSTVTREGGDQGKQREVLRDNEMRLSRAPGSHVGMGTRTCVRRQSAAALENGVLSIVAR